MQSTTWASAEKRDPRNTAVGWIVLLALIVLGFFVVAAIAAEMDSGPTATTCTGSAYSVSCVTR